MGGTLGGATEKISGNSIDWAHTIHTLRKPEIQEIRRTMMGQEAARGQYRRRWIVFRSAAGKAQRQDWGRLSIAFEY